MPRRVIGSDSGGLGQLRQTNAEAGAQVKQGYQFAGQGNQQLAQISQQITQNQIESNQQVSASAIAIADSQAKQAAQRPDFAFLGDQISNIGEQLAKRLGIEDENQKAVIAQELKDQEEKKKAAQQEAALRMSLEIDQHMSNVNQQITQTDSGARGYEDATLEIAAKYKDQVAPDDFSRNMTRAYGAQQSVMKEVSDRTYTEVNKIHSSYIEQQVAGLHVSNISAVVQLKNAAVSGEDPQQFLDIIGQNYVSLLQKLSPEDALARQEITTSYMKDIADGIQGSEDTRLKIQNAITGYSRIDEETRKWIAANGTNDPNGLKQVQAGIIETYGLNPGLALQIGNPNLRAEDDLKIQQLRNNAATLLERNIISATEAQGLNQRAAIYQASIYMQNPGSAEVIKNNKIAKNLPRNIAAFQIVEQVQSFQKNQQSSAQKMAAIDTQIANGRQSMAKFKLGQVPGDTNQINATMELAKQFAAANNVPWNPPATATDLQSNQAVRDAYNAQIEQMWMDTQSSLNQQKLVIQQGLDEELKPLIQMGVYNPANGKFFDNMTAYKKDFDNDVKNYEAIVKKTSQELGGGNQGADPNFKPGTIVSPTNVQLARTQARGGRPEIVLPFRASDLNKISLGSEFGNDRGTYKHQGLDIPAPTGLEFLSMGSGTILYSGCNKDPNGYGCYVDIKDDATGWTFRYAHASALYYKTGQKVKAGRPLGKVGNTGGSRGAHLHFETRDSNNKTVDPETALGNRMFTSRRPSGDEAEWHTKNTESPEYKIPLNAVPLKGGKFIINGVIVDASTKKQIEMINDAYNNAQPIRTSRQQGNTSSALANPAGGNKINKDSKGNWSKSNYGYNALANRSDASRQKIHEISDRLGFPAIWLVDMIGSIENVDFDPSERNQFGCTGLIQFCADRMGGDTKTIGGKKYNLSAVAQMTDVQQLELAYKYLEPWKGKIKSFNDVWSTIRWGMTWNQAVRAGKTGSGDGNGSTWYTDVKKVRSSSGRDYTNSRASRVGAVTHTKAIASCPMCNQLASSNSNFVPHEGQV